MLRQISPMHLFLILTAFVMLFGYKRLPDATRSLGRSLRIFSSEVKSLRTDDAESGEPAAAPVAIANERPAEPVRQAC
jgi:sec-independent protein translocase protein TatA